MLTLTVPSSGATVSPLHRDSLTREDRACAAPKSLREPSAALRFRHVADDSYKCEGLLVYPEHRCSDIVITQQHTYAPLALTPWPFAHELNSTLHWVVVKFMPDCSIKHSSLDESQ